jgi:hypothetical protein
MSGLKVFRLLFSLILVLSLPAAFPWFLWLAKDHVPLEIAVVDKTVPTEEYREHRALFWTLKHTKVVKPDTSSYQEDVDYVGYHPDTEIGDEVLGLPTKPALIYVADTYGVYERDLEGNPFGERSDLLYGGLSFYDWNRIMEAKEKDTTLIVEFNSIASPTPALVRELVEKTVGISWSGWIGRYFNQMEGTEVPLWLKDSYEKQTKHSWQFTGEGMGFVHESGQVIILDKADIHGSVEFHWEGTNKYVQDSNYEYWFDVVKNEGAKVEASYRLPVTETGKAKLVEKGIPLEFPAVLHKNGEKAYYFAGDFADIETKHQASWVLPREFYKIMGFVVKEEQFFWNTYIPLMEAIINKIE